MAEKKKKKATTDEEKEHKKNWREVYASVGDIKAFLGGRLYLRHNVITGRQEELARGVCVGRGHQGVPRREAVPQA